MAVETVPFFGRWLRQRRRQLDLTQELLAERVGCSTDLISKIERGERRPSREIAMRIFDCLEVPPGERPGLLRQARALPEEAGLDAAMPAEPVAARVLAADARVAGSQLEHTLGGEQVRLALPPAPPTSLVGRDADVARVGALLRRADARLLTLVGPGGVGKTRLALAAIEELRADFPDGVVFVSLIGAREPSLVSLEIASTLGVYETDTDCPFDCVVEAISARRMLLVLDNFEHVLDAASDVGALLAACPQLAVLTTSRARLQLRGEQVFEVAPLALPDLSPLPPLEVLAEVPSVALFVRSAQAVRPDFALDAGNAATIAQICHRLDGLPLAIELAAARMSLFSAQTLLQRLDRPLGLLTGGARDLPPRQRALRLTLDWSYSLLEPAERQLFARLAVFVGGATLEAAEFLAAGLADAGHDILALVDSLLDKSLLRRVEGRGGAEIRVIMLETVREYALEQLQALGEAELAHRRQAAFFVELATRAEPELWSGEQAHWLDKLDADYENLRAVLAYTLGDYKAQAADNRPQTADSRPQTADADYALAADPVELGLRLAAVLYHLWVLRSRYTEGRRWLELALERSRGKATPMRARALNVAGKLAEYQGDHRRARQLLTESLELNRQLGDEAGIAAALLYLGRATRAHGDYARADTLIREGLDLYSQVGSPEGIVWALLSLGDLTREQGDLVQSQALFEEALRRSEAVGSKAGVAPALMNLGQLAARRGDFDTAQVHYDEALALFHTLGSVWGIAETLLDVGRLAHARGNYARAAAVYHESLELLRDLDGYMFIANGLEFMASLAVTLDQHERAARLFGAAAALRERFDVTNCADYREEMLRDQAASRAALGNTAWQAVWEIGRTLSVERALAEALAG